MSSASMGNIEENCAEMSFDNDRSCLPAQYHYDYQFTICIFCHMNWGQINKSISHELKIIFTIAKQYDINIIIQVGAAP